LVLDATMYVYKKKKNVKNTWNECPCETWRKEGKLEWV